MLRPDLPAELERKGADTGLAKDVALLLDACDTLRFTGTRDTGPENLVDRGVALVSRLGRVVRKVEGRP